MTLLIVAWVAVLQALPADTLALRPPPRFAAAATAPIAVLDTLPPARVVAPDVAVAIRIREAGIQRSPFVHAVAEVTGLAAFPGAVLLSLVLYGAGELDDRPQLAETGERTGLAIAVATGTTGAGKMLVGRARPIISPYDPYDAELGRGFRGSAYQSFPSAHTAIAFATAVALSAEVSEHHPEARGWVLPTSYGMATLAGLSRIFRDQHWASDVIAGALVGALSGWAVTR